VDFDICVDTDGVRDSRAFKRHIEPLIAQGLIEMTIPDKPNSRNQKYVRTSYGGSDDPPQVFKTDY